MISPHMKTVGTVSLLGIKLYSIKGKQITAAASSVVAKIQRENSWFSVGMETYLAKTPGSEWAHSVSCSYFLNAPQKTGQSQGKAVCFYHYAHIPNPVHSLGWVLAFMSYLEDRCEKIIRGKECYSSLNSRRELIVAKPLDFFFFFIGQGNF